MTMTKRKRKDGRISVTLNKRETEWLYGIIITFIQFDNLKGGMTPEGRILAQNLKKKFKEKLQIQETDNI